MSTASATRPPRAPEDLARLVHDLRAPLTVIRGLCDVLARDEQRADRRRGLRLIDDEAMRLADALGRLLPPSPAGPVAAEVVDLAALAARAVERHRALAARRGARIGLRAPGGTLHVKGDPERLERALDNLLGNAVRHCAEGGRVVLVARARGGRASLSVRDDGPGVPPSERERIFRPGERGSAPRGAGQGLGLAIAREIAREHDGSLTLDRLGTGACFRLTLPLAAPAGAAA